MYSPLRPTLLALALASSFTSHAQETESVIVVTASRGERALEDAPTPMDVVGKKTLEARGVRSFNEAVNTVPGVFSRPGRGLADIQQSISLHGVPEEKRTLVLLDGQPVNDTYAGGLNLGGLPVSLLERVEISQGPASALYGGNAMGGVVHYITRLPKGPEATLRLGYGDAAHDGEAPAATRWTSFTGGTRLENGLAFLVGASYRATHGYASEWNVTTTRPTAGISGAVATTTTAGTPAYQLGTRGDNRWMDQSVSLRLALPLANGARLSASFLRQIYDYDFGAPETYLRNAAGAPVYAYGTVRANAFNASYGAYLRDLWQFGYEAPLGGGDLKLGFSYATTPKSWYVSSSGSDPAFATTGISGGPGRATQGQSSGWNLDAQWTTTLGLHTLTLGAALRQEQARNEDVNLSNWKNVASFTTPVSSTRGRSLTSALFAQDEWRLAESTTAWLGARWDHWSTYDGYSWNSLVAAPFNAPQSFGQRNATALSPKLSLVHRLTPMLALRASLGRAFRPPSVYELYRTLKIGSLSTVYQNNPLLVPEKTTSADLGIEARPWQGAKLGINWFHNRFTDLIYTAGSGNPRTRVNAGLAESKGLQVSLEQKLSTDTRLFANLTQQRGTVRANTASPKSVGKELTSLPQRMVNLGLETRQGPWSLTATARHASRQFSTDDNSDTASGVYGSYDGYTVADSRLAYRLTGGTEIGFAIDNLTDRKYFSNYIAPGRSWSVDLTLPF